MGFIARAQNIHAPSRVKPKGSPEEKLIYANQEEIDLLKSRGGSGTKTPWGPRSYSTGTSLASAYSQGTTSSNTTGGTFSTGGQIQNNNPDPPQDDDPPPIIPQDRTETIAYTGGKPSLRKIYDAIAKGGTGLADYLKTFSPANTTKVNETGGTTTIKTTPFPHGLSPTMTLSDFEKDKDGNIIGYKKADGTSSLKDNPQFAFNNDTKSYVFVGKDSVDGFGGDGTFDAIGADGKTVTVGARTFEEALGVDPEALEQAKKDRSAVIQKLKGRSEYYGGTYSDASGKQPGDEGFDESTAKFGGGLEEKFMDKAEGYEKEGDRLLKKGESEFSRLQGKSETAFERLSGMAEDEYKRLTGIGDKEFKRLQDKAELEYDRLSADAEAKGAKGASALDRADVLGIEAAQLAKDTPFFQDLQEQTDVILSEQRGYRGELDELRRKTDRTPKARAQALFAEKAEEISRGEEGSLKNLNAMLVERGINPTSIAGMSLTQDIKRDTREAQRGARRSSLNDAIAEQMAKTTQQASMIESAQGMTAGELATLGEKRGIRKDRISGLKTAADASTSAGMGWADLQRAGVAQADASGAHYRGMATEAGDYWGKQGTERFVSLSEAAKRAGDYYGDRAKAASGHYEAYAGQRFAQAGDHYGRSADYGAKAMGMDEVRLSDALDRQYAQEDKQAAAMQMRMDKWALGKEGDLAVKLAKLKASYGKGATKKRSSGFGRMLGTIAGAWLSKTPAGAQIGGDVGDQLEESATG